MLHRVVLGEAARALVVVKVLLIFMAEILTKTFELIDYYVDINVMSLLK